MSLFHTNIESTCMMIMKPGHVIYDSIICCCCKNQQRTRCRAVGSFFNVTDNCKEYEEHCSLHMNTQQHLVLHPVLLGLTAKHSRC